MKESTVSGADVLDVVLMFVLKAAALPAWPGSSSFDDAFDAACDLLTEVFEAARVEYVPDVPEEVEDIDDEPLSDEAKAVINEAMKDFTGAII